MTASQMNSGRRVDRGLASYCGIAASWRWLVWRKGGALIAALVKAYESPPRVGFRPSLRGRRMAAGRIQPFRRRPIAPGRPMAGRTGGRVRTHAHARSGSSFMAPFPGARAAAGTVIAAGARPCSGAHPGAGFRHGARAVRRWGRRRVRYSAIGTASTTTWSARLDGRVRRKSAAMRPRGGENSRLALVAKGFEFAAALAVLAFGPRATGRRARGAAA